jgi:hypothetical protein
LLKASRREGAARAGFIAECLFVSWRGVVRFKGFEREPLSLLGFTLPTGWS